jgi:hypothetical protein
MTTTFAKHLESCPFAAADAPCWTSGNRGRKFAVQLHVRVRERQRPGGCGHG